MAGGYLVQCYTMLYSQINRPRHVTVTVITPSSWNRILHVVPKLVVNNFPLLTSNIHPVSPMEVAAPLNEFFTIQFKP